MNALVFCFVLLAALGSQPEGRYERHNQSCGGMNGADVSWSLDIRANRTYNLSITQKTNDYLQKPKSTFIIGTWEAERDTLRLYQWGNENNTLTFYRQDDKLMFRKRKLTLGEGSLLHLDYLVVP